MAPDGEAGDQCSTRHAGDSPVDGMETLNILGFWSALPELIDDGVFRC